MQFFRNFFKSKIGLGITLLFLALIAVAFASSDVANTTTFGGVAGGDRVAVVGDARITTADLSQAVSTAFEQARLQDPALTMREFVEAGGLEQTFDRLVGRAAVTGYGRDLGLRAGNNLVNSEIRSIGAFRGPSGTFDENLYRQILRQQGLSDKQVREDLQTGLIAQQLLRPADFGATMPQYLAGQYAALFKERRVGQIALIPSASMAPAGNPSDRQLQSFYRQNRAQYVLPERRVVRFVTVSSEAVDARIAPTPAAIAAYYRENREQFAPSETRSFSQIIAANESQARSLLNAARSGASLDATASNAGLRATTIGPITQDQLRSEASEAVARAVFAAQANTFAGPVRSALGWHVVRVGTIDRAPGRTLAQASEEIRETLTQQNRRLALADIGAEIEERLAEGDSLSQVAQNLSIDVEISPALTVNGTVYGANPRQTAAEVLQPAIPTIFQMEESEPQIAEIEPGQTYLLFEVARITEAAAAPLSTIRDRVTSDWRRGQGQAAARRAADRVLRALQTGTDLRPALQNADAAGATVERVDLTREQLSQQGGERIPPPIALLFSMAEGSAKKLEAANDLGWFVVNLENVEAGRIEPDDPLMAQANRALGPVVGEEYLEQFVAAIQNRQGEERNDAAIAAVRRQLIGEN